MDILRKEESFTFFAEMFLNVLSISLQIEREKRKCALVKLNYHGVK